MGRLTLSPGSHIYLDADIITHEIEGHPTFAAVLNEETSAIDQGRITASTSEIALIEVLPQPLKLGLSELVSLYTALLSGTAQVSVLPVDRKVLDDGAKLRASMCRKTPDAIHMATARAAGAR